MKTSTSLESLKPPVRKRIVRLNLANGRPVSERLHRAGNPANIISRGPVALNSFTTYEACTVYDPDNPSLLRPKSEEDYDEAKYAIESIEMKLENGKIVCTVLIQLLP